VTAKPRLLDAYAGWYRGGCWSCPWLGPYRKTRGSAKADARQHMLDVIRYPNPEDSAHGSAHG
jgi:hypothetical protein